MSSILKALKKLEVEKALLQDEKEINVSREILKQSPENRNAIKWLWLLGSSAAVIILILTFALIRKSTANKELQSRELPIASQPAPPLSRDSNLIVTPGQTGIIKAAPAVSPLLSTKPGLKPSRHPSEQTGETHIKREQLKGQETTITLPVQPKPDSDQRAVTSQPLPGSEQTLQLSGIAWNKDSADRLAIINGQPTSPGGVVNGVVVDEILQDRVKLSRNGRIFELLIGKSARTD